MNPQPSQVVLDHKAPATAAALQQATANLPQLNDGTIFSPIEAINAGARMANAIFQLLKLLLIWLVRGIIAPAEVVLRYRIGERYFNATALVGFGAFVAAGLAFQILPLPFVLWLAVILFLGMKIHWWACFVRDRRGGYWHSFSEGESWLRIRAIDQFLGRWFFTIDFSKLILEPAFLFVVSYLAGMVFPEQRMYLPDALGGITFISLPVLYLRVASVTMFLYQLYCWSYRRNAVLDEKDAFALVAARNEAAKPAEKPGVRTHLGVAFLPPRTAPKWGA